MPPFDYEYFYKNKMFEIIKRIYRKCADDNERAKIIEFLFAKKDKTLINDLTSSTILTSTILTSAMSTIIVSKEQVDKFAAHHFSSFQFSSFQFLTKELEDYFYETSTRHLDKLILTEKDVDVLFERFKSRTDLHAFFFNQGKKYADHVWNSIDLNNLVLTRQNIRLCLEYWTVEELIPFAPRYPKIIKWLLKNEPSTAFYFPTSKHFLSEKNPNVLAEMVYLYRDFMIPFSERKALESHILSTGIVHLRNLAYFLPKSFRDHELLRGIEMKSEDACHFFNIAMALDDVNNYNLLECMYKFAHKIAKYPWFPFLAEYIFKHTRDDRLFPPPENTRHLFPLKILKRRLRELELRIKTSKKSANVCFLCHCEIGVGDGLFSWNGKVVCKDHIDSRPILF
jgi:hypothetical protein